MTPTRLGGVGRLRDEHTQRVLEHLYDQGPSSVADLVLATGLSRRPLSEILEDLTDRGWAITMRADGDGHPGRPANVHDFDSTRAHGLALHITATASTASILDARGKAIAESVARTDTQLSREERLEATRSLVLGALNERNVGLQEIAAAVVATAGVVDDDGVVSLQVPGSAPLGWSGFRLADELALGLSVPVAVENDSKLAAFAEHECGIGRDVDSLVWLTAGRRSGLGIVLDGRIHRGHLGRAGEVARAPAFGLAAASHGILAHVGSEESPESAARAASVLSAARAGDERANRIVDSFADAIVPSLATVAWTLAPELIVLGSDLSTFADLLIPRLEASLAEQGLAPPPRLAGSQMGATAPIRGAELLAASQLRSRILSGDLEPVTA